MNTGSELIISWLLTELGYDEKFTKSFIYALYQGCASGEVDATTYRDNLISQATLADQGEMAAAIAIAHEFHLLKIQHDQDKLTLESYTKIDKLLEKTPTSILASKVMSGKLESVLTEYRNLRTV